MAKTKLTKQTYIDWFKLMFLIRRFEEKSAQMYGQNKIRGFCHLYIGQEAITAGMSSAMQEGDKVITAGANFLTQDQKVRLITDELRERR